MVESAESAGDLATPRTTGAGTRPSAFESLRVTNFRYLLGGTAASSFAMWMEQIGQGWLVAQLTNSPFQLGLVQFIRGISVFAVSPFVGSFSDRIDRRLLAGVSSMVNGLGALAIAILIVAGQVSMWHLYVVAFIGGFSGSIYTPVRQFLVFDAVDRKQLPNAIALNAMVSNAARAVGPGIAGFMIGISLSSAFFGKFVFFTVASLSLVPMHLKQLQPAQTEPMLAAVRRGAAHLLAHRTLLRLTLLQAIPTLLVYPYLQLVPIMTKDYLHSGPQGYGWLQTGVGIGAIIGGVAVARFSDIRHKGLIMSIALVVYMSMILAFSFSRTYWLSLSILITGGVGFVAFTAFNQTLLQLHVADEYRGRVLALYTMSQGLNPFGSLAMGTIADRYLGTPHAIAVFVVTALVLALFSGLLSRDVRSL